jgi:hypothetical protein
MWPCCPLWTRVSHLLDGSNLKVRCAVPLISFVSLLGVKSKAPVPLSDLKARFWLTQSLDLIGTTVKEHRGEGLDRAEEKWH